MDQTNTPSPTAHRRRGRHVSACVLGLIALTATACSSSHGHTNSSGSGGSSSEPSVVKMVVPVADPSNNVENANSTSIPTDQGYFKAEHLDVSTLIVDSSTTAVQLVLSGHAQVTVIGLSGALTAAQADPNVRVVAMETKIALLIGVPADSNIHSFADLAGKNVGVQSLSSATALQVTGALNAAGVTGTHLLTTGVGAQAAAALQSGRIDAYASFFGPIEPVFALLNRGVRYLTSPLDALGGNSGIVTSASFLAAHPQAVEGFIRAYFKGGVFAKANPAAAVQIHWKVYPGVKPTTDVPAQTALAVQTLKDFIPGVLDLAPGQTIRGLESLEQIQKYSDFLLQNGVLKSAPDLSKIVDLSLVKSANKFDEKAIQAAAAAYK